MHVEKVHVHVPTAVLPAAPPQHECLPRSSEAACASASAGRLSGSYGAEVQGSEEGEAAHAVALSLPGRTVELHPARVKRSAGEHALQASEQRVCLAPHGCQYGLFECCAHVVVQVVQGVHSHCQRVGPCLLRFAAMTHNAYMYEAADGAIT